MRKASTTSLNCQACALLRNCASSTNTQCSGPCAAMSASMMWRKSSVRSKAMPSACSLIRDATVPLPARKSSFGVRIATRIPRSR